MDSSSAWPATVSIWASSPNSAARCRCRARLLNDLVRFNPRGLIANYVIALERATPRTQQEADEQRAKGEAPPLLSYYRFKGDLQGISVQAQEPPPGLTVNNHPRAGIPGIENLWGNVDADQSQGSITIDTKNAAITMPGVFDDPRLTSTARMAARPGPSPTPRARRAAQGVHGAAGDAAREERRRRRRGDRLLLEPGPRTRLARPEGELRAPEGDAPRPLSADQPQRKACASISATGCRRASSRGGTIEVHGDLTKFPYARIPDAGIFHIEAPFTGGKFDPTPFPPRKMANGTPNVWPGFDGIDGKFQLAQNKLRFDIDRAHYQQRRDHEDATARSRTWATASRAR